MEETKLSKSDKLKIKINGLVDEIINSKDEHNLITKYLIAQISILYARLDAEIDRQDDRNQTTQEKQGIESKYKNSIIDASSEIREAIQEINEKESELETLQIYDVKSNKYAFKALLSLFGKNMNEALKLMGESTDPTIKDIAEKINKVETLKKEIKDGKSKLAKNRKNIKNQNRTRKIDLARTSAKAIKASAGKTFAIKRKLSSVRNKYRDTKRAVEDSKNVKLSEEDSKQITENTRKIKDLEVKNASIVSSARQKKVNDLKNSLSTDTTSLTVIPQESIWKRFLKSIKSIKNKIFSGKNGDENKENESEVPPRPERDTSFAQPCKPDNTGVVEAAKAQEGQAQKGQAQEGQAQDGPDIE